MRVTSDRPIAEQRRQSIEEHYEVIEAIRRGDAKAARESYRSHRERGLKEEIDVMTVYRIHGRGDLVHASVRLKHSRAR